jgi:hypothetical protein
MWVKHASIPRNPMMEPQEVWEIIDHLQKYICQTSELAAPNRPTGRQRHGNVEWKKQRHVQGFDIQEYNSSSSAVGQTAQANS